LRAGARGDATAEDVCRGAAQSRVFADGQRAGARLRDRGDARIRQQLAALRRVTGAWQASSLLLTLLRSGPLDERDRIARYALAPAGKPQPIRRLRLHTDALDLQPHRPRQ